MVERKLFWRIISIIVLLAWLIVFFAFSTTISAVENTEYHAFNNTILYLISILLSICIVIFPLSLWLYTIMCCLWGLLNLFDGGSINGILMYSLGCLFFYKAGFFIYKKNLTYILLVLPLVVIATQYRLGLETIVDTTIDLLFLVIVAFLVYALFNESAFSGIANKRKKLIDLSILKPSEIEILQEVLANKTYNTIGVEKNKSESSIKLIMQEVHNKLHVKGKKELMDLYEKGLLVLPEQG